MISNKNILLSGVIKIIKRVVTQMRAYDSPIGMTRTSTQYLGIDPGLL